MKVFLNIYGKRFIEEGVQHCNTPEGFRSIQKMHPEDTFIVENEESQEALDSYEFLSVCIIAW